jgi:hypothetical protein
MWTVTRFSSGYQMRSGSNGRRLTLAPPNKGMEPTSQIVTPFAYAKGAPICLAAHPDVRRHGCFA